MKKKSTPPPSSTSSLSYKIINGDALEEIDKLSDNSIDLIITDPPYFIDKLDNTWSNEKLEKDVKNSHITNLPKGMKFDRRQTDELYHFYTTIAQKLFPKLKPGGYFLSFSSPRLYHSISMACHQSGFEIRDMINWVYTQTQMKGMSINHLIDKMKDLSTDEKQKFKEEYQDFKTPQIKSCFEPICVAMKPIPTTFVRNEIQYKTGLLDFSPKVGIAEDRVIANVITTQSLDEIYDKNFLVSKPSKKEKKEYNNHPTVKPLELMEHLIKIFSKKGAIVLDPFLGSGTTMIACKQLDRACIGIELNKEYVDIVKKRLDECK